MFERVLAADADHSRVLLGAHDAQRTARIQVIGGERQRIEHGQPLAIIQLAADRRSALADRDAAIFFDAAHLDIDDARLGFLADVARRAVPPRQHVVRRHGRMADKTDFSAGREEASAHAVVAVVRRQDESRIGIVELARDREHLGFGEAVGIQHDTGRVAGEALAREGINLVDLNLSLSSRGF